MSAVPLDITTHQPINHWFDDWDKYISSEQLEKDHTNKECILTINTCLCIKRILFMMRFYSIWMNSNMTATTKQTNPFYEEYLSISISDFIHRLKYYSIVQLINDWHHLRQYHWTDIHSQHDIRALFQYATVIQCIDLSKCRTFHRINRDRQQTKHLQLRKQLYFIHTETKNDSIEITYQQICDSIHDLIFHSPIITFPAFITHDNDDDEKTNDDILASPSSTTSDIDGVIAFEKRKKVINKLQNGAKHYYQHSKFVTSLTKMESDIDVVNSTMETKSDDAIADPHSNMKDISGCYAFGIEMMYSEHYKSYAKFKNMKEEITLHNNDKYCISMHQWNDTITKSKQYVQSCRGKEIEAKVEDTTLGVHVDDRLSIDALVALSLYTNFTDVQRRFSGSTRRFCNQTHETDDDLRVKHYRDYFYWGQSLMIAIKCYGEQMDEHKSFYHGINTELLFTDFTAYFNCPTSSTILLSIAMSFASDDGIILKLSGRIGIRTSTTFMDVSWFSDYPNEEERLFYGCHNILEIVCIFQGNSKYKKYIRAIKVMDMLTDPNMGGFGIKFPKKYAKLTEHTQIQKSLKYLHAMIQHRIDNNNECEEKKEKKIPKYMLDIFEYFCNIQTQISVDTTRLILLEHEISHSFMVFESKSFDTKYYSLNFNVLCTLFPNLQFLSLDFGFPGHYLNADTYGFICKTLAQYLDKCIQNDTKCRLKAIEFKGLIHRNHLEKEDKTRIKKKYSQSFAKWNVKIDWLPRCINFRVNGNKKLGESEHIYVGNLHASHSESGHIWCMFVSTSKDKLIHPKTIKQVRYYLNSNEFDTQEIVVKKSPFYLKRNGTESFKIDVKIVFNKNSKRNSLYCWHLLDVTHPVSITDVFFDTSIKKHAKNDVVHSRNYKKFHDNFP